MVLSAHAAKPSENRPWASVFITPPRNPGFWFLLFTTLEKSDADMAAPGHLQARVPVSEEKTLTESDVREVEQISVQVVLSVLFELGLCPKININNSYVIDI